MATWVATGTEDGVSFALADVGGFTVAELRFPPGYRQPALDPDRGYLAIVLDGGLEKQFPARTLQLAAASVATIPANAVHSATFGERGARVAIVKPPPRAERPYRRLLARVGSSRDCGLAALGERISAELQAPDVAASIAVEGLALELVAAALRSEPSRLSPSRPPWLSAVVELLHEPAAPRGLTDLGEAVGVHPAHLARVFRRHYGASVGTYLRRLRLERAAARLTRSTDPIVQISVDEGFSDQAHFTRAFKRHVGISPARYRRVTQGLAVPLDEGEHARPRVV